MHGLVAKFFTNEKKAYSFHFVHHMDSDDIIGKRSHKVPLNTKVPCSDSTRSDHREGGSTFRMALVTWSMPYI